MLQSSQSIFKNRGRYKPSESSWSLLEEVIGQKREVFIRVNFLFNGHQKHLGGSETSLSKTQPKRLRERTYIIVCLSQ